MINRVPTTTVRKKVSFTERALATANPEQWFVLKLPVLNLDTQVNFTEFRRVNGYWEMK